MGVYPDMDDFYADLGHAYAKAVQRLLRRRLPLSAARRHLLRLSLRSRAARDAARARRRSGASSREIYAGMVNAALEGQARRHGDHHALCRGNFRSTFIASGGYEPVADLLFNSIAVDGYFMEWDTDRAGGFEPLRFLPKGKTRRARPRHLEDRHAREARTTSSAASRRRRNTPTSTSSASRPQCGFASTEEGNVLAEDEQWAKLRADRRDRRGGLGLRGRPMRAPKR